VLSGADELGWEQFVYELEMKDGGYVENVVIYDEGAGFMLWVLMGRTS